VVNTESTDTNRHSGTQEYTQPVDDEPDQLSEFAQQREENQGAIPRAFKNSYKWVRGKLQYVYDKIRGRVTNEQSDNPEYWAGRTDGRALGSV
jgi:hypothetical protein